MTHVKAEYAVVKKILSDVDRRREKLGARVAACDIENCLEDTVSIFEAALKALVRRYLKGKGMPDEGIDSIFKRVIRNQFQSILKAHGIMKKEFSIELFQNQSKEDIDKITHTFEKRHPITHNLGIVDRKYLESVRSAEREGRDVRVTVKEINDSIDFIVDVLSDLHLRLFQENIYG